jgi:glycosyltransferase involved in cell wall biosynthesis
MIAYNVFPFIMQAIESVLQQKTDFPFELVIGEDCSTDGTREIVFGYRDKYPNIISVVSSDKNVGMAKNRLRTIKACRGKYIAFCDGDDYWHNQEKLQKQVGYMESHSECGLVYSSYDVFYVDSGKRIKDFINHKKWEMPQDWSAVDFIECGGGRSRAFLPINVVIRTELYKQISESDPYLHQSCRFLADDTQIWADIADISSVYFIPESMATYNVTAESETRSSNPAKRLRFSVSNAELMIYLCDKYHVRPDVKKRYQHYWCNSAIRLAFYTRDAQLAEKARKTVSVLTWKEWLQYFGAKHQAFNALCMLISRLVKPLRRGRSAWT